MEPLIFDLDDFCELNHSLDLLLSLKEDIPQLKVTLFTIPGKCRLKWLNEMAELIGDWAKFIPHGWLHQNSRECQTWTYAKTVTAIALYDAFPMFERGFKAPGWQISDESYHAFKAAEFWVADQAYNSHRRPEGLKYYEIGRDSIHGHIGHLGGHNPNELSIIAADLKARSIDREFDFVSNHLQVQAWQPSI